MISYLIYHYQVGSVSFKGQGYIRPFYFAILISHTILATLVPPLAVITIYRAFKGQFAKHKRIAKVDIIATIFFIRTQAASAADPTNKFETRLVINDTVIDPDLVRSVTDTQQPIFIDRFGQQTTSVPDDNYFLEGKGSALYKLDDLQTLIDSTPAKVTGENSLENKDLGTIKFADFPKTSFFL